jgi:hypothetical protein
MVMLELAFYFSFILGEMLSFGAFNLTLFKTHADGLRSG